MKIKSCQMAAFEGEPRAGQDNAGIAQEDDYDMANIPNDNARTPPQGGASAPNIDFAGDWLQSFPTAPVSDNALSQTVDQWYSKAFLCAAPLFLVCLLTGFAIYEIRWRLIAHHTLGENGSRCSCSRFST